MTLLEIKRALRSGQYAWPGGYPLYFITSEGDALCFHAVRKNWRNICEAHIVPAYRNAGWFIIGCEINHENGALYCAETNRKIESTYDVCDVGDVGEA